MKKWQRILVIIAIIVIIIVTIFIIGTEITYKELYGEGCCPCSSVSCSVDGFCIGPAVCCDCKYNVITKLMIIINDYIL